MRQAASSVRLHPAILAPVGVGARFVVALALLASMSCSPAAAAERPNIVLVMADDQGWGDMAYNGHPTLQTPHFDEAAASGLRFDRFYAAAPVCSPTRASVMTGRHPNRMGVFQWGYPLRPQESTIAEALQQAGYATAHFGKWHLGSVRRTSPANPGRNGFDHWISAPNFYDNDPILSHNGTAVQEHGESSMVTVDAAIDWLAQPRPSEQPFFAVIWFGSPHSPHRAAPRDRALYADQPPAQQNFLGEVTGMDRAFGKLRQHLKASGQRENTILWYCSDNGGLPRVGSTGDFRGDKGDIYEGGLLVPAFVEWPAVIDQPRRVSSRCSTSDFYPTLLEITGIEPPSPRPLDGISLLPLLAGKTSPRSRPLGFWDMSIRGIGTPSAAWMAELLEAQQAGGDLPPHPSSQRAAELPSPPYPTDQFPGHAAWTDGDWKLHRVENKQGQVRWELYNLAEDPEETRDLAATDREVVKRLRPAMQTWLTSVVASLNGADY